MSNCIGCFRTTTCVSRRVDSYLLVPFFEPILVSVYMPSIVQPFEASANMSGPVPVQDVVVHMSGTHEKALGDAWCFAESILRWYCRLVGFAVNPWSDRLGGASCVQLRRNGRTHLHPGSFRSLHRLLCLHRLRLHQCQPQSFL